MKLIKALEHMENGDGIILVDGKVVKFSSGIVYVTPSASFKPEVEVDAKFEGVTAIKNKGDIWFRLKVKE